MGMGTMVVVVVDKRLSLVIKLSVALYVGEVAICALFTRARLAARACS